MKTLLLFLFTLVCLLGLGQENFVVNQDTAGAKISKLQIKKAFDKHIKKREEIRDFSETLDRKQCSLGQSNINPEKSAKLEKTIDSLINVLEASENEFNLSKKEIEKDSTQTLHKMFAAFKAKYSEYQNAKLITGNTPEKDSTNITEKFVAFLEEEL